MKRIKTLKEIQKEHVQQVLDTTRGDRARASRILGISLGQLSRLINEHNLEPDLAGEQGPVSSRMAADGEPDRPEAPKTPSKE